MNCSVTSETVSMGLSSLFTNFNQNTLVNYKKLLYIMMLSLLHVLITFLCGEAITLNYDSTSMMLTVPALFKLCSIRLTSFNRWPNLIDVSNGITISMISNDLF